MNTPLLRVLALAAAFVIFAAGIARAEFSSSPSSSLTVSTLVIGPVTDLVATSSDSCATVTVAWTRASGADTHAVEVRRDSGAWEPLVADTGDVASIVDTAPAVTTQVEYRVVARDAGSGWSGPAATSAALACA